jgi:hypothetical protein
LPGIGIVFDQQDYQSPRAFRRVNRVERFDSFLVNDSPSLIQHKIHKQIISHDTCGTTLNPTPNHFVAIASRNKMLILAAFRRLSALRGD